jgi:hypothetical protein
MQSEKFEWKKYIIVFFITVLLFISASYVSNYFSGRKIGELKSIQDQLSINILSSETQYSLLAEMSCKNVSGSALSAELGELGSKLEWGEKNLGATEEVTNLRKYYSLLEIKDYLLMKRISARCGVKSAFILYFYTTAQNCSDCERQGLVLSALKNKYPELRVYSFDFSTDLSAVKAIIDIYKIKDTALPALVIEEDVITGFHTIEDMDARVQEAFKLKEANAKALKSGE